ncbi:MAG: ArsR family transcriptional regulator [Desulfobacteraceae bacterium]|nr:MAG: ArsR family transcriptional regulator [Desulfobacteraceae bacterium]
MKSFIKDMRALSEPNRVKILKLLQHKSDMCVCELKSLLHIAQPTVSKHLKVLEEAGLVEFRKEGLWVNYSIVNGSANPYAAAILRELHSWLEDQPEIDEIVKKAPFVSREEICKRADS